MSKKRIIEAGDFEIETPGNEIIEVGDFEIEKPTTSQPANPFFDYIQKEQSQDKLNEIVNNLPIPKDSDSEGKKQLWKDLALKGASKEVLSDALLTLQGKHPHQDGGTKYYLNDNGVPVPLKNSERPPVGFEVASVWGTRSDAKDDNPITDLAKTVFNIMPAAAENLVDLAQTGYEAITDESSDMLNSLKNAANSLKFEKDPDIQKPMLNIDGIDEFSDILDANRWDFSPETLWGTTLGLLGSVGEMYVGGSAVGKGIKGAKAFREGVKGAQGLTTLGKPGVVAATYAGSFMTNLGEVRQSAEEAGLTGRDKALVSGLITGVVAAFDAKYDLGGKILSNKLLQEEKKNFVSKIAKNVAARSVDGQLTKEALDGLAKATTVGYSQLAKKWSKETATDILQQGGEEAAQAFMQNAGEQLWDQLSSEEKAKFGTNAFSAKSFAEYLREGLAGAIGGAPTAFAFNKVKQQAKKEAQSNTAFGIATKGEVAVKAFKENVKNELALGKLTQAEADNALFQVDAYYNYDQSTKDLNLSTDDKRRVFDLTFEKQSLESQIPTEYKAEQLNPIEQAKIETKKKKAKDIQDELNKIFLKYDVQDSAAPVAEKTKEEVAKGQESEADKQLKKYGIKSMPMEGALEGEVAAPETFEYKIPEKVTKETRTIDEIPNSQWNNPKFDVTVKFHKLADKLSQKVDGREYGIIKQDIDYIDKKTGHRVDTFNVTTPDGKSIRFASSMVRRPVEGAAGGFRGNTYEENFDNRDNPIGARVGVKLHTLGSGRNVMFIYNAEPGSKYGKHLGMIKETLRGKSNYSQADIDEMLNLQTTNMGLPPTEQEEVTPENKPIAPADVAFAKPVVKKGRMTTDRNEMRSQYIEEQKQLLKEDGDYNEDFEDIYEKSFGNKFDRLNPEQTGDKNRDQTQAEKKEDAVVNTDDLLKKISVFNGMSVAGRKSEQGVSLYNKINEEAKAIGHSLNIIKKGKIQLLNEKGKQVYKKAIVRTSDQIAQDKAQKEKERKALKANPVSIEHAVALDVANGVRFNKDELVRRAKIDPKEVNSLMTDNKKGQTFEFYATNIVQNGGFIPPGMNDEDVANKAAEIVATMYSGNDARAIAKEVAIEEYEKIQNGGVTDADLKRMAEEYGLTDKETNVIVDAVSNKTDEEVEADLNNLKTTENEIETAREIITDSIGEENRVNNPFDEDFTDEEESGKDIITGEGEDVFQKSKELLYAEAEFKKAQAELTASKKAYDAKRKELDAGLIADQEDLFGERKSQQEVSLFDERASTSARNEALIPFKKRYENALENYSKWQDKVKGLEGSEDTQTSLFQKGSKEQVETSEKVKTILDKLKKSMPKVKVVIDENLPASGKWSPKTNTVTINPFYAGVDTPIHEYGHILIDAIGYNNKVIQSAIKQLKGSELWKETKARYPELNEENLAKEVLAEAIGLEGAGIFDKEADKSKFRQYLEYIFDWFKTKLGLNKNIAKSLAKQVISGIGTKGMMGEAQGKEVSLQLPSGERVNGVEVMPEVVNGFYSKLEKQLLQMKLDKAPAKQWNEKLKGEEAKWTGLSDWLSAKGQTAVTRQEIKDFLKNNRIQLVEVTKGERKKPANTIVAKLGVGGRNTSYTFYYVDAYGETSKLETVENPYTRSPQEAFDRWVEDGGGVEEMADFYDINQDEFTLFDSEYDEDQETKYHQYQLPGEKENYRELLITKPFPYDKELEPLRKLYEQGKITDIEFNDRAVAIKNKYGVQDVYRSSHWNEPNILVHLRMNERTDAEGNKVLFLEEVQSDWGQEGKKKGFELPKDEKQKLIEEHKSVLDQLQDIDSKIIENVESGNKDRSAYDLAQQKIKLQEKSEELKDKIFKAKIPTSPFVTDTSAWVKLGLKYALKQAVESGATKIAWTTGEQQNERYDLSKTVDEVTYDEQNKELRATKGGSQILKEIVEPNRIEDYVGKDVAERLLNQDNLIQEPTSYLVYKIGEEYPIAEGSKDISKRYSDESKYKIVPVGVSVKKLSGEQLKVGGKGMKGFYDKILPDVFKSLVKELTGKSGEISSVSVIDPLSDVEVYETGKYGFMIDYTEDGVKKQKSFDSEEKAQEFFDGLKQREKKQQSIAITPELAQSVSAGMPMFQKPKEKKVKEKKKPKSLEELSDLELEKESVLRPRQFIANNLQVDLAERKRDIKTAKEKIANPNTSKEEKAKWQKLLDEIAKREKREIAQYYEYRDQYAMLKSIVSDIDGVKTKSIDELVDIYNRLLVFDEKTRGDVFNTVREQLAYKLFTERKEDLKKHKMFIEEMANKKDMHAKDVLMKTLSHMTQSYPELQQFSKMFDSAYFDMTEDRYKLKNELEKLGKAVIAEKNKKLGIGERLLNFFSSDNAKYFEYLENPKAIENVDEETGKVTYEPGYWTIEEAKAKGFSNAQIEFLKFMRRLGELRKSQMGALPDSQIDREVLKVDKTVSEAFKTEGMLQALSSFLGNGFNVRNVRINFTDPVSKKVTPMSYGEIEKKLFDYGKKGTVEKVKSMALMVKYQFDARRQLKLGVNVDERENPLAKREGSEYQLNPNGTLDNKFFRPRDKNRGYSKDFYRAAFDFIDDYTHSKHMSALIPYVDSIQYLNENGYAEHMAKPNVAQWVEEWKNMHLFKTDKQGALGPEADAAMRMLRKLTSQIVMAFNIPAGLWNAFMGQYNNWRTGVDGLVGGTGHKRLFGGSQRDGSKVVNKKAADILKKYQVVSVDYDSNPKLFAGRLFDNFAHGLTRLGEFYIQGSMFLGQMSEEEWNSFEYKKNAEGVEELVYSGKDEKAFKEKMIKYKNRVSDIQGKYADKDRRNFMNGEFGKLVSQFKVWIPDWWKERFGERYITRDGEEHFGSYRGFVGDALRDLRKEVSDKGLFETMVKSNSKEAIAMRQNLKGAMFVAAMYSMYLAGSDDEKKRRKGDMIDQALGNVLFVFNPNTDQLKFMVKNPVAAFGTIGRFVDILDYVFATEEDDFYTVDGRFGKKGDSKLFGATVQVIPYNKLLINEWTYPREK